MKIKFIDGILKQEQCKARHVFNSNVLYLSIERRNFNFRRLNKEKTKVGRYQILSKEGINIHQKNYKYHIDKYYDIYLHMRFDYVVSICK